jgi:hypothetical protein
MKISSTIRVALLALVAFAGAALSSACRADEGFVSLVIYKAGWVIGGSGGGGTLTFHGRSYPLSAGGLDYGLVFGGSKTVLRGRVSNIYRPFRCRRRLWRGRRGPRRRPRRPRDCADQPEGRGAGTVGTAGRPDGERGFERAGDYVEVGSPTGYS